MPQPGLFISFEGSEGCGKSTQIQLLTTSLRALGRDVVVVREPGGTPIGEAIRHLLQHAPEGERMVPETELLLFAASRAQLVRETIRPALAAGSVVISDRFLDSTTVYQGVARRIPDRETGWINAFAVGGLLPDRTFLLDIDPGTAALRLGGRSKDRIERESTAFFEAVRTGYLALASREPTRIVVLDAARPPEALASEILASVTTLLPAS